MTASKLSPRKEKSGSKGCNKHFQNNLSYLVIKLVITVSIRVYIYFFFGIFLVLFLRFFWFFTFLYIGYGAKC